MSLHPLWIPAIGDKLNKPLEACVLFAGKKKCLSPWRATQKLDKSQKRGWKKVRKLCLQHDCLFKLYYSEPRINRLRRCQRTTTEGFTISDAKCVCLGASGRFSHNATENSLLLMLTGHWTDSWANKDTRGATSEGRQQPKWVSAL